MRNAVLNAIAALINLVVVAKSADRGDSGFAVIGCLLFGLSLALTIQAIAMCFGYDLVKSVNHDE